MKKRIIIISVILTIILISLIVVLLMNRPVKEWTVTSYSPKTGTQAMIYTITDNKGRLIIIDGGYEDDADQIRKTISEHDNHVYAWIVSHPHFDHAGAFNVIMSEDSDITVDTVYVTNLNYDRYKETAQPYDVFETCDKYCEVISKLDNVTILKENDSFDCLGLKFTVLHSWNEEVDGTSVNLCNNGSLVFTVEGKEEKMLFCSDVQSEMQNYIIERHKAELADVKYIQAGHHGNWGMTKEFYDNIIAPKTVFFDSTDELLEPGELGYDAGPLKEYFENRGTEVLNYSTAPNSIVIR